MPYRAPLADFRFLLGIVGFSQVAATERFSDATNDTVEAILVEVPNPNHPYGVKGVGEANIVPPMAAIANAIQRATGKRLTELPMSPPKVLAAIDAG